MTEKIIVKFKRWTEKFDDIPVPEYSTQGSAGMDIRAALSDDVILNPGEFELIPTNISVEIPPGFEIQVRPRSGLAVKHGIGILNSPGTIDSDYRGEIKIILFNMSREEFIISSGDRIAQLVLSKVYLADMTEADKLNNSLRGDRGFGHTGKD